MTLNKIIIINLFLIIAFSCTQKQVAEEEVISDIMRKQQDCWNKGDVDCFMNYYWKNDSLRFIGRKGINYGWETTLSNYKKSYPTKKEMGELTFVLEDIQVFTATEAYVLGKWELNREEKENLGGYFSLLWRKIDGNWVIVSDHTS